MAGSGSRFGAEGFEPFMADSSADRPFADRDFEQGLRHAFSIARQHRSTRRMECWRRIACHSATICLTSDMSGKTISRSPI